MNSHNTKSESVVKNESIQIVADREEVRVIKSAIVDADLSISTDDDLGSDPYNSTGQYVVLKSKLDSLD